MINYIKGAIVYGALRNVYYLPKMYDYENNYENGKRKTTYIPPLFGEYVSMGIMSTLISIGGLPIMLSTDINRLHAYYIPELRKSHKYYFESSVFPYFGYKCRDKNLFPDEFK